MTIDPLYLFVFFGLFSPGPNVILITTSGARFGVQATLPHILGVAVGVGVTSGLTGFGIGGLLQQAPRLELALKIISALWILYMAYGLWNARRKKSGLLVERPMRFHEAVLFQWVNPKVWAVALAAVSAYPSGQGPMFEALRVGSAFSGTNLFVCLFWTFAGSLLSYLLTTDTAWTVFNRVMAAALAAFSILIFL